jgi:hypothetical protein
MQKESREKPYGYWSIPEIQHNIRLTNPHMVRNLINAECIGKLRQMVNMGLEANINFTDSTLLTSRNSDNTRHLQERIMRYLHLDDINSAAATTVSSVGSRGMRKGPADYLSEDDDDEEEQQALEQALVQQLEVLRQRKAKKARRT